MQRVLKEAVWNNVKTVARMKQVVMSPLTSLTLLIQGLVTKAHPGSQTITGLPTHLIYPHSTFHFGVKPAHVIRCQPNTIEKLKSIVEDFANSFSKDKLIKMARNTRKREELSIEANGVHFEHLTHKIGY